MLAVFVHPIFSEAGNYLRYVHFTFFCAILQMTLVRAHIFATSEAMH